MQIRIRSSCGAFIVFGLLFAGLGLWFFIQGEQTKSWRPVNGTVVSSEVDSHRDTDGDRMYSAKVVYEFTYRDAVYKGNKIGAMDVSTNDRGFMQRVVHKYPVGTAVKVYVNPADPYSSVLETGGGWFPLIFLAFGLVFAGIGAATMFGVRRSQEAPPRDTLSGEPQDLLSKL